MRDWFPVLALLAVVYVTAFLGHLSGLVLHAYFRRGGRRVRAMDAAGGALLAPLSVLALPIASLVYSADPARLAAVHSAWHDWEDRLPATPLAHGLLHAGNLLLLLAAVLFLPRLVYLLSRAHGAAAALQTVQPQRVPGTKLPLFSFATDRPLCFTTGLLRPRIYISDGLLEHLSARERAVVLAHEAAHLRRRDSGMNVLLVGFYTLFPLPGGALLYHAWKGAAERACDAEAARRVGDPCDVAAALVRVARLSDTPAVPGAACFAAAGEDIEGRVHALLALPRSGSCRPERYPVLVTLLIALHMLGVIQAETGIRHFVELLVYH